MGLLDFVFPKFCVGCRKVGEYICTDCFSQISFDVEEICLACNRPAIAGVTHPGCRRRYVIDGTISSISYKKITKRLIYNFKYKPYLTDLEKVLCDLFYEGLIQSELFQKIISNRSILVPIPLYITKQRERGYNQAEILAKNLSKRFGINTILLLQRVRLTESQFRLKRVLRAENVKGSFAVNCSLLTPDSEILLVDDVITTGATMLEAANVLKRAGAKKVWGIALAHGK